MRPVLVILGTRPEAIKLWPVIEALRETDVLVRVVSTGQQQHLVEPMLLELGIALDCWPMRRNREVETRQGGFNLVDFLADAVSWLTRQMVDVGLVVVQGDTTTALAGALAAFYAQIPIAHVEAGLRTYDLACPFPEEGNRQLISRLATLHFCPTDAARFNLIDENGSHEDQPAFVVGNTVVDAALRIKEEIRASARLHHPTDVLVTFHRRESWPDAARVAQAIVDLTERDRSVRWVLHGNPALREQIREAACAACTIRSLTIDFVEPLGYRDFITQLLDAELVITDSGGVVEEAVTLGRRCIILRDATERHEALEVAHMLGVGELDELPALVDSMLAAPPPKATTLFGDGNASERIAGHIVDFLRSRG